MKNLSTYLCGSIQDATDGGVNWRDKISEDLKELGVTIFDPCKSECNQSLAPTIEEQKKRLENLKRGGSWDIWDEVMNEIRRSDLIAVNSCNFMIVFFDPSKKMGGTIHEIVEAWQKHIPIYTILSAPYIECNDWVLSLLRNNFKSGGKIFQNPKQCIDYIKETYKDYIKENQKPNE